MGLEEIKEKIIDDAKKEKSRLIAEAEAKAVEIRQERNREAENRKTSIIEHLETEGNMERSRILTIENLESRKKILQARQDIIESVFSRALDALSQLDDYEELMEHLIIHTAQGGEEIILSPEDKSRLSAAFFDRINKALPRPLIVSEEERDISGGFILKSGDIEINESFDDIIKTLRDEMEGEVAKIAFTGDNQ